MLCWRAVPRGECQATVHRTFNATPHNDGTHNSRSMLCGSDFSAACLTNDCPMTTQTNLAAKAGLSEGRAGTPHEHAIWCVPQRKRPWRQKWTSQNTKITIVPQLIDFLCGIITKQSFTAVVNKQQWERWTLSQRRCWRGFSLCRAVRI